ncbi:AIPR family protein [Aquimarina sp. 2201CG1-2-11]|uniref:AIPR family protein n=1 Tax=Aquimarina discodermiae TaxID=3231043 RepID=UPI0034622AA0
MNSNIDLIRFRTELLQDIVDNIRADESGGIKEEKFTEIALEYLEESGETEGARSCREIRENSIGNRIHKINGYALSEGYETIDIFITNFKGNTELKRIYADELKSSLSLSTRFIQNLLNEKMGIIEETAPVFDFIHTINKLKKDIVRINVYILSDFIIPIEAPNKMDINDIPVLYHIRDIEYLYRIHASGSGKEPITIDFEDSFEQKLPCISTPTKNQDYDSYLAVIPAQILANIYRDYGSRLLEQNVRTFLQFRGKINKGIRDTILKEPHMFMAYNNGIAATAESVTMSKGGNEIISIKDFQIVNGGQTTASIFQTRKKHKETNLEKVSVQLKLTVIHDQIKKADIVSRISQYANTQNKVSDADLTSNHPFHIDIEALSRKIWASSLPGKTQTRWFYERARGQYNDELYKMDTRSQRKKWTDRNPKNQKFAKEDLARFHNSWEQQPWWVVKGRQRNFVEFMKFVDNLNTDSIFYEDLIAKAIVFRTAERLYGRGAKAIGDLRYMVVPYTVAWLNLVTNSQINLVKIWKNQVMSDDLETILYVALRKVDVFMRKTAPGGLIGEWAKKEECWKKLKTKTLDIDLSVIDSELYSPSDLLDRYSQSTEMSEDQRSKFVKQITELTEDGWLKINNWGKSTGKLDVLQSNFIWKVARKIDKQSDFSNKEIRRAIDIIDLLKTESPKLVSELIDLENAKSNKTLSKANINPK